MEYTLQKVNWGNIGEAVCVEEETLPNSCYLRDNSDYFLNQTKGELTLVLSGDEPVGIGKLSLLPDGSGWLETLRVRPDWQGQGVGKAIYNRWLKEARLSGCLLAPKMSAAGDWRNGLAFRLREPTSALRQKFLTESFICRGALCRLRIIVWPGRF